MQGDGRVMEGDGFEMGHTEKAKREGKRPTFIRRNADLALLPNLHAEGANIKANNKFARVLTVDVVEVAI
jgi:hypothetical protein